MSATKSDLLKTIRAKCLDCTCDQIKEVQHCPAKGCVLWPFRMGKDPDKRTRPMTEAKRVSLDAARKKAAEIRQTKKL